MKCWSSPLPLRMIGRLPGRGEGLGLGLLLPDPSDGRVQLFQLALKLCNELRRIKPVCSAEDKPASPAE
jgi:hypothetical protein